MATLQYFVQIIIGLLFLANYPHASTLIDYRSSSNESSSSFITLTSDRLLALPPRTLIVLTPTVSVPMQLNDAPIGFGSSMTFSIPFKINCDDLGVTSQENTWGHINQRKKREVPSIGNLAGGDREVMYKMVEKSLQTVGVDGKACLLRAICEMFGSSLENYGFIGEVLELFFSPSRKHKNEERLTDYVEAEEQGKHRKNCDQFHKACPYSFFVPVPANAVLN